MLKFHQVISSFSESPALRFHHQTRCNDEVTDDVSRVAVVSEDAMETEVGVPVV